MFQDDQIAKLYNEGVITQYEAALRLVELEQQGFHVYPPEELMAEFQRVKDRVNSGEKLVSFAMGSHIVPETITKVCSGAQTGADIGGLIAAKRYGIPTGGWIPRGFITQNGLRPEYAELYGIQEHSSPAYPPRTFLNVKESDGTIRFAADFYSPGELCTMKAIQQYKRPYFDVNLVAVDPDSLGRCVEWIKKNQIHVLNVAGNAEKTHRGCQAKVEYYLGQIFNALGFKEINICQS